MQFVVVVIIIRLCWSCGKVRLLPAVNPGATKEHHNLMPTKAKEQQGSNKGASGEQQKVV
jgi:hypothetical protein